MDQGTPVEYERQMEMDLAKKKSLSPEEVAVVPADDRARIYCTPHERFSCDINYEWTIVV
jgi:hypothetical protein